MVHYNLLFTLINSCHSELQLSAADCYDLSILAWLKTGMLMTSNGMLSGISLTDTRGLQSGTTTNSQLQGVFGCLLIHVVCSLNRH